MLVARLQHFMSITTCLKMRVLLVVLLSLLYRGSDSQLVFKDSPATTIVLFNFPTILRCSASEPNPPANIIWLKDEVISTTDPRGRFTVTYDSTTGSSEYSINTVSYQDNRNYQCVAVDAAGNILANSAVGQLTVQGYPGFAHPLPSVTIPLGATATFECPVLSNPPANVSWAYQDNSPIPSNSRFTIFPANTLMVENVQLSDERFYVCHAVNTYGRNSSSARLTIGTPPPELNLMVTPSFPDPLRFNQGNSLSLSCSVSPGSQFSSIIWTRGSTTITSVSQTSDTLLLSIAAIEFEDGGVYTCTVVIPNADSETVSIRVEVDVPPQFTATPEDIVVTEGVAFTLTSTCAAVGEPKPTITWHRPDETQIPVQNEEPQLGILTRADDGVFVCLATNSVGQTRHDFTITVQGRPLFSTPPANTEASFGQDVVFVCIARGPPDPSYSWTRLGASGLPNGTIISADATRLHLLSVTTEDEGVYQCNAINVFGSALAQGTLSVLERPQILDATYGPVYVEVGTTFSLVCSFSGPLSVVQVWSLNGAPLSANTDPNLSITPDGTLTVAGPQEQYSGEYVCNVTTSYSFDFIRITVFVGRPPQFTRPPSDSDLSPGSITTIPCVSSGQPQPWSTWFKTDVFGVRTELPTLGSTFTKLSSGLELHDVNREDSGLYECMVDNGIGVVQQSATVRVEGAPLVSRVTPSQLSAGEPSATLQCLTNFNYPTGSVIWSRADGVELSPERYSTSSTGDLLITNVTVEDQAVWVCNVTNLYGTSGASGPVLVLVAPSINFASPEIIVTFQTSSSVSCPASGTPTPQIQWLYNGAAIEGVSGFDIDPESGDLRLSNPIPNQEGTLTCVASNSVGMTTADVELLVRGPPVRNLNAVVAGINIVRLTWTAPLPVAPLIDYQVEVGRPGVSSGRTITATTSRTRFVTGLSPGVLYEFIIRGSFSGGLVGEDAITTGTTLESAPAGPPQNITLTPRGGAFNVQWTLPLELQRNGEIVSYTIFYRRAPQNVTSDPPFSNTTYLRNNTEEVVHSLTVEGLDELTVYEVKLRASTIVGDGPESALLNVTTERRMDFTPVDYQLVVNVVIGVGAAVLGSLLLVTCVLAWCVVVVPCWRRWTKFGKHKPLTDEEAYDKQRNTGGQTKTISGPIPGITPKFDSSVDGKFKVQGEDGRVLNLRPKVIREEDVATPPRDGENVKVVPRDEILVSQGAGGYDDPADAIDSTSYHVPRAQKSRPTTGQVIRPESGIYSEVIDTRRVVEETDGGHPQGGHLDRDAQEESETNLTEGPRVAVIQPPSPQRRGPEGHDTGKDTSQLIYASVSDEHKQKKRGRMTQQEQEAETVRAKQDKKMQDKMEREKKKQEEKIRKQEEKEKKKREKEQAKQQAKRASLGLDNVVHLHELSSTEGRAQAQFIDAATAALF